jgi:glyoxylase-like metal-dependent hydrolase (beta-lactamase superfamily II)
MQVAEGVFQLLTPFPQFTIEDARALRRDLEEHPRVTKGLPYVLPYMIKSQGEVALIDCGWNTDSAYQALEEDMKSHGSHPEQIQQLIITHVHPDHYGMAGRLKQISSCDVVMHRLEADVIKERYFAPKQLTEDMAGYMVRHGVPQGSAPDMSRGSMGMLGNVAPVNPDNQVHGGETFGIGDFDFEIIWTPGHAPGHICLYEPNRKILLTGDHILPTITPNVSMHTQSASNPLGDYMAPLDKVANLDVELVLPAHEFNVKDLKVRIQEIHDHHKVRLAEMMDCVDRGGSTAYEVAGRVKWATGMLADFEPWIQRAAVGETLAHLEYLFEEGQLSKHLNAGTLYWVAL